MGFKSDNIWNKILLLSIVSFSIAFFLIKGIGKGDRVFQIAGVMLVIVFIILFSTYSIKFNLYRTKFSIHIFVMLFGILLSTFAASYFYGQNIGITIYQQRYAYYFFLYFLLPYLLPDHKFVKNVIYYFAIIGAIIYILQQFAYPVKLTEAKMFFDRGTLRINLPGVTFIHLGYFLCVDYYFRTSEKKYAIGALILLATAIVSGFRSILSLYIVIAGVYLILNKHVKNRFYILILAMFTVVAGFFAFQGIINEMQESAERETSQGSDYIRVRAGTYFLNKMLENKVTLITGNGQSSERSQYGIESAKIAKKYGYYLSDIGIVGSYFKFGFFYVAALLLIFIKILTTKLPEALNFIKLFIIMKTLTLMFGSIDGGEGAVVLCLILYLIDSSEYFDKQGAIV